MSDDSAFREINEELRSDRLRNLWRQYGAYVIGAAVAVVVLVGAAEGWRWWQDSNAARSSDLLYSAFELAEEGDAAAAQDALNVVAAEGSGEYPLMARFRQAALLASDGKTDEAVAAFDALSNASSEPRLRELALVLAAYQMVDTGDVAGIQARVGGLIGNNSPMRNTAREALGLAQYATGDLVSAAANFQAILDDPLSADGLRGRAQVYVAQLTAEGAVQGDEAESAAAESDLEQPAETEGGN